MFNAINLKAPPVFLRFVKILGLINGKRGALVEQWGTTFRAFYSQ